MELGTDGPIEGVVRQVQGLQPEETRGSEIGKRTEQMVARWLRLRLSSLRAGRPAPATHCGMVKRQLSDKSRSSREEIDAADGKGDVREEEAGEVKLGDGVIVKAGDAFPAAGVVRMVGGDDNGNLLGEGGDGGSLVRRKAGGGSIRKEAEAEVKTEEEQRQSAAAAAIAIAISYGYWF